MVGAGAGLGPVEADVLERVDGDRLRLVDQVDGVPALAVRHGLDPGGGRRRLGGVATEAELVGVVLDLSRVRRGLDREHAVAVLSEIHVQLELLVRLGLEHGRDGALVAGLDGLEPVLGRHIEVRLAVAVHHHVDHLDVHAVLAPVVHLDHALSRAAQVRIGELVRRRDGDALGQRRRLHVLLVVARLVGPSQLGRRPLGLTVLAEAAVALVDLGDLPAALDRGVGLGHAADLRGGSDEKDEDERRVVDNPLHENASVAYCLLLLRSNAGTCRLVLGVNPFRREYIYCFWKMPSLRSVFLNNVKSTRNN